MSSSWNIGFWFAVIGRQATQSANLEKSLALAGAVLLGAGTWTLVLSAALGILWSAVGAPVPVFLAKFCEILGAAARLKGVAQFNVVPPVLEVK